MFLSYTEDINEHSDLRYYHFLLFIYSNKYSFVQLIIGAISVIIF